MSLTTLHFDNHTHKVRINTGEKLAENNFTMKAGDQVGENIILAKTSACILWYIIHREEPEILIFGEYS